MKIYLVKLYNLTSECLNNACHNGDQKWEAQRDDGIYENF